MWGVEVADYYFFHVHDKYINIVKHIVAHNHSFHFLST